MEPRTTFVALVAFLALTGSALATHGAPIPGPTPGTDDLGLGTNDVREEPSHPDDANGFPADPDGPYFSPATRTPILDSFVAQGTHYGGGQRTDVAADNLVNRALHGDNYDDHERTMYPGLHRFGTWWGWWADTGGGGDLQGSPGTSEAPFVGSPNGAIDDAPDCKDRSWDEWIHRGPHPCPDQVPRQGHPDDQLFAFVQPGTHAVHFNSLVNELVVGALLDGEADHPRVPDFRYRVYHERWEEVARPVDIEYDSSLLVTTTVTTAANPKEVPTGPDAPTRYDPQTPATDLADPDRGHAVDVDVYTTPHRLLERAYRTAVWDPGGAQPSPLDALHPEGPKGWAKEEVPAAQRQATDAAEEAAARALQPSEPQRGLAQDLASGPFFQEPNTADDGYGITVDGKETAWATHDPSTTYGGLGGDYFDPGPGQAHPGYADGERFWLDARAGVYYVPVPIAWGFGTKVSPEVPAPSAPAESTASEGDDNSQAPGFLYIETNTGTWHDENGDGWVGDAGEDGHAYDNGTTDDPHDYSSDEFQGTCGVDLQATLYPTSDTDGDGTNDWGAAGVYEMDPLTLTYGSPWMDVVGTAAEPLLDPVRGSIPLGDLLFPERKRLAKYHRTGPIHLDNWVCFGDDSDTGYNQGDFYVVLPEGNLDFTFKVVTEATLTDPSRVSDHGDNKKTSLTGQEIVDVDRFDPVLGTG